MARVHLKVAAGLSSTGSTGRVPVGALGLGGVGKQTGHQMCGYVQLVEGRAGCEVSSYIYCAHWCIE